MKHNSKVKTLDQGKEDVISILHEPILNKKDIEILVDKFKNYFLFSGGSWFVLNLTKYHDDDLREGTIFEISYELAPETYFDVIPIDISIVIIKEMVDEKDVITLLKSLGEKAKGIPWKHLIKLEYPKNYKEIYRVYPYMFLSPGWKGLYLTLKYYDLEILLSHIYEKYFKYMFLFINGNPILKEFISILWILHNYEYAFEIGGKDQEFRGRLIEFAGRVVSDPGDVNIEYFLKTGSLSAPFVYTARNNFYPIISNVSVLYKFLSDPHVSYQDAYDLWDAIIKLKIHGIKNNIDYFSNYLKLIKSMESPLLEYILQENPSEYFIAPLTYQRIVKDILEIIS